MKRETGTFINYGNGREYIALSEAARHLDMHQLSIYDEIKLGGIPLITISGCKCIAVDDLEKIRWGAK